MHKKPKLGRYLVCSRNLNTVHEANTEAQCGSGRIKERLAGIACCRRALWDLVEFQCLGFKKRNDDSGLSYKETTLKL